MQQMGEVDVTDVGPVSAVTFLFTDIEGSTRLWEKHFAVMRDALARHDTILQGLIALSGGKVFKTVGDGIYAVFNEASAAVEAALAIQQHITTERFAEGVELRVRLALHTGSAAIRADDYFGPTLNRTARLLAAGHGGQILLSGATVAALAGWLPQDASLRDLGVRQLRDISEPEHIYQLVAPHLPQEFPPLRTVDSRPHNLPAPPTSFIDRTREVAEVCAILREHNARLVTVTGAGGVGKTRLAGEVATHLLDEFAAGIYFVELAGIRDPGLIAPQLAKQLLLKETGEQTAQEQLASYLSDKQILIVLDNFEQVMSGAPLVSQLLKDAPFVSFLVTSRERLALYGEYDYPLAPLPTPNQQERASVAALASVPAVMLFASRAAAQGREFMLADSNAQAVAEICVGLDGLPLAIELAAARTRLLTPQQIVAQLQSKLQLLTTAVRDLPPRQRSLRGAIDWSYDLLGEEERLIFRKLAVFAGGARLEAVEQLTGEGELDVLTTLYSLVDKSLVSRAQSTGDETYFTMLETVREYALEKLRESGEEGQTRQQQVKYYAQLAAGAATGLRSAEQVHWLNLLERELDNIRAVLDYALEAEPEQAARIAGGLGWFWLLHGYLREGRARLTAVAEAESGAGAAAATALNWAGNLATQQGDYSAALNYHQRALRLRQELGDKIGMAGSFNNLGLIAHAQGDNHEARWFYEESLKLWREAGNRLGAGSTLHNLANVTRELGELETARQLHLENLSLMQEEGYKLGIASALMGVGGTFNEEGDDGRAINYYAQALTIASELGDEQLAARLLIDISQVATRSKNKARVRQGVRLLAAASTILDKLGAGMEVYLQRDYDDAMTASRARLSPPQIEAEWQVGAKMSVEEATALVLRIRVGSRDAATTSWPLC